MHLSDAFIQSDLQSCNSDYTFFLSACVSLGIEPTIFALLTQCSTIEPQKHWILAALGSANLVCDEKQNGKLIRQLFYLWINAFFLQIAAHSKSDRDGVALYDYLFECIIERAIACE